MQVNKNPELYVALFLPFLGLNNLLRRTPHGNEIFWPSGFSATSREELYHPPGEQQTCGKSRFVNDGVLIVLGSRA